jgi:hypothetical protein
MSKIHLLPNGPISEQNILTYWGFSSIYSIRSPRSYFRTHKYFSSRDPSTDLYGLGLRIGGFANMNVSFELFQGSFDATHSHGIFV